MPFTLRYLSGSPYAWRVRLALAHKGLPFTLRTLSYDAGDFRSPDLARLNPRRRVPVLEHDDFVLYESAAILEYLEDIAPAPPLLAAAWAGMRRELALWESLIEGPCLAGALSAADYTLYPLLALGRRIASRVPGLTGGPLAGPALAAWEERMRALPIIRATWPPHWDRPA